MERTLENPRSTIHKIVNFFLRNGTFRKSERKGKEESVDGQRKKQTIMHNL